MLDTALHVISTGESRDRMRLHATPLDILAFPKLAAASLQFDGV